MEDDASGLPAYEPGSRPQGEHGCTHGMGYVRQDVYACRKCAKLGPHGKPILAGFCRGCRNTCHAECGDAVIDLYSKRYFRCDCGNSRMANTCALLPQKCARNEGNERIYNHNFTGTYCRCDRDYMEELGGMLQCTLCDDWFHESCVQLPTGEGPLRTRAKLRRANCELICAACADRVSLFDAYQAKIGIFPPPGGLPLLDGEHDAIKPSHCTRPPEVDSTRLRGKDRLWRAGFRLRLCKCDACLVLYRDSGVSFVVDRKDFVNLDVYEELLADEPVHDVVEVEVATRSKGFGKKRRSASRKLLVTDVEKFYETLSTPSSKSNGRLKRRKPPADVSITAEEREHIQDEVTKFVNESVMRSDQPADKLVVRQFLLDLRDELLAND